MVDIIFWNDTRVRVRVTSTVNTEYDYVSTAVIGPLVSESFDYVSTAVIGPLVSEIFEQSYNFHF